MIQLMHGNFSVSLKLLSLPPQLGDRFFLRGERETERKRELPRGQAGHRGGPPELRPQRCPAGCFLRGAAPPDQTVAGDEDASSTCVAAP